MIPLSLKKYFVRDIGSRSTVDHQHKVDYIQIATKVYINTSLILLDKGLVIYNSVVGGGRIQNNMTKILSPPLTSKKKLLTPLTCKGKEI